MASLQANIATASLFSKPLLSRQSPASLSHITPPTLPSPLSLSTLNSASRHSLRCSASLKPAKPPTSETPSKELSGDELSQWLASRGVLEALGMDGPSAETALAKAFGWIARAYWQGDVVNVVPSPSQVAEVVGFLQATAAFSDADFKAYLKDFPQVLACSVEKRLQPNVARLEREWRISGDALRGVVLRNPLVLGYTLDCKGDCESECDYCWARF